MTELRAAEATPKPSWRARARLLSRALADFAARRPVVGGPGVTAIRHSAEIRQPVLVLTLIEVPVAFLVSGILPPAARPFHAALEVLLILTGCAVLAALARSPHTVSAFSVVLRTGFLGGIALPRHAVRSATRQLRTIEGRGLRRVPGEPSALACSVGSLVNVGIRLASPVTVDLGEDGVAEVSTVYIAADTPAAVPRALLPD